MSEKVKLDYLVMWVKSPPVEVLYCCPRKPQGARQPFSGCFNPEKWVAGKILAL